MKGRFTIGLEARLFALIFIVVSIISVGISVYSVFKFEA